MSFSVQMTGTFETWLTGLSDFRARARIFERLDRVAAGHIGDVKNLGGGLSELRIHYGPGYRLYFTRRDSQIIWLLTGGNKDSQNRNIAAALRLLQRLPRED